MDIEEERRLLGNYRGRRLLACRSAQVLQDIVGAIGRDDGSLIKSEIDSLPAAPTAAQKRALSDGVNQLLRLILSFNDGRL